jgi:purine-nucleoside phosphorylase
LSAATPFAAWSAAVRQARPRLALVLGSGLNAVGKRLSQSLSLPFSEVPGFVAPTVPGHRGCLTLGFWSGRPILLFEGRCHYYEGHPWRDVSLPVRTAAYLGIDTLVLTNAAGGIRDSLVPGSLMIIRDHLDWTQPNWWRAAARKGTSAPRQAPYSPHLSEACLTAARLLNVPVEQGTYAAVTGPSYETPAEVRALRCCGADAVGMSTAHEASVAADLGLACLAISCITNPAAGRAKVPLHHGEVLQTAAKLSHRLADVLERWLTGFLGSSPQVPVIPPRCKHG